MYVETSVQTTVDLCSNRDSGDRFSIEDLDAARRFYLDNGYVILHRLNDAALCDRVMTAFNDEVRFSKTPMLRQKNMRYERNQFSVDGLMTNPIFNIQDLQKSAHGAFRDAALDLLSNEAMRRVAGALLGAGRVKLIQSMFFEAPAGTWPHQDSYYQDSARELGGCVAAWFALEDIQSDAGRFFICPGSHQSLGVVRNDGALNFANGHEAYKKAMHAIIDDRKLPVKAPALWKGDVLFWNSLTVHGSQQGTRAGASRRSLTAHYLREDDAMLQFHARVRPQNARWQNGMQIGLLHPQDRLKNRITRFAAFRFPRSYMAVRKTALKVLLATRRR